MMYSDKKEKKKIKGEVTFPRFRFSCGSLKAVNSLGLPYRFTKHGPNVGRKPRLSSTARTQSGDGVLRSTRWNVELKKKFNQTGLFDSSKDTRSDTERFQQNLALIETGVGRRTD